MSIEKLLERLIAAIEADTKSREAVFEHYRKTGKTPDAAAAETTADKSKAKAKSNDEDEDEDEDEEEESTTKGKKAGKGKKATKAAKGKKAGKGKKASDEDEEDEEDEDEDESEDEDEDEDEDDEEEGKPIKIGDIRDVLVELKEVTGKKGAAKEVLKEFGYDELGDADPRDFKALMTAAQKALTKAKKKK